MMISSVKVEIYSSYKNVSFPVWRMFWSCYALKTYLPFAAYLETLCFALSLICMLTFWTDHPIVIDMYLALGLVYFSADCNCHEW